MGSDWSGNRKSGKIPEFDGASGAVEYGTVDVSRLSRKSRIFTRPSIREWEMPLTGSVANDCCSASYRVFAWVSRLLALVAEVTAAQTSGRNRARKSPKSSSSNQD